MKLPDGWNIDYLDNVTKRGSGHTPNQKYSEYWNGGIKWVSLADSSLLDKRFIICTAKEISEEGLNNSSAVLHPKGTVLMSRDAGVGKSSIMGCDMAVSQHFITWDCKSKNIINNLFLYYWLQAKKGYFERQAVGSTIKTIGLPLFKKLKLPYPPLSEQKAIADLLSTWDEAIEKTERLIQAKERNLKSQIQKIMGRQAIETKGWSEVHLGELFTEVTHKVGEKELTPYSISAGIGFVSQREKWGKNISGSQHKNYIHLKTGEFSYNKGNSKRYQQGCIYLLKEGEICVPNVFISFKPKNKNVVPEFFEHYFIADYHARELKRYITSGARSDGLLNLNKKDFFKIKVPCPSPYEQKAIAEALTALQHEIDLLKQLAEKYKAQKRGLMQKMLTGEWRMKPEIINQYTEA
ncbi:MAG: Type-1 restriction enzyme MjaXIP specificity protein [Methanomethylovorans sp. PtaU1.Bin073]|nr:MAG: Type-1 restriction enzyme MjaXIP specificity protein [Methanomethylovorans sp. PtaU1.Bin073]